MDTWKPYTFINQYYPKNYLKKRNSTEKANYWWTCKPTKTVTCRNIKPSSQQKGLLLSTTRDNTTVIKCWRIQVRLWEEGFDIEFAFFGGAFFKSWWFQEKWLILLLSVLIFFIEKVGSNAVGPKTSFDKISIVTHIN